jgi:ketosteroid isomerase-like protein
MLDLGIQLPSAFAPLDAPFQAAPQVTVPPLRTNPMDDNRVSIPNLDFSFYEAAKNKGLTQAWTDSLSPDAHIYRQGEMPVIGKDALKQWVANQLGSFKLNWTKADLSESDDFGYSHGSYEIEKKSEIDKGYYVRVWKRDAKNNWRIVFDVAAPLPEEKKQGGQ